MGDVTKSDLWDVRDGLLTEMRAGFKGVHDRQDVTNGRVNTMEQVAARHDVRLKNLERETFSRAPAPMPDTVDADKRAITQRDVLVFGGGVGVLWAVLKGLAFVATIVH